MVDRFSRNDHVDGMWLTLVFAGTAVLFAAGALSCLWHLRWMRRLPALEAFKGEGIKSAPRKPGRCSVVVAARNEGARIEETLRRLLAQHDLEAEFIVVDDRSMDGTSTILEQLARRESRLRVIRINALPEGWLGKCHACHVGASAATGEWILFTDGDCWFKPDVVARALRLAQREGVDHVTLTSGIAEPSPGLRASHLMFLISMANWFSGVNRARPRSYLGLGAFNLVRADAYRECGGYEALRLTVLDDVKLGLLLRRAGKRTRAFLGADDVQCHWGTSAWSMIRIMEKNYFATFEFRTPLALGVCALLTLLSSLAVLGLVWRTPAGLAAGLAPLSFILPAAIVARRIGWPWHAGLAAPFVVPVFICALFNSTLVTLRQGGIRWRETFYSLEALRAGGVK